MPKISTPKYRRQKTPAGDRAFVELNGVRHYLGLYGSPDSKQQYHRLLAEWSANGGHIPVETTELTMVELTSRFWTYAKGYYVRPDGSAARELANFKPVIKILKELYETHKVTEFGPLALKAVRGHMIGLGSSRYYVNKQIGRLRMIFRWGVAEELIDASVYQALLAVPGLKRGRTEAPEGRHVKPVPQADIDAIQPFVSKQVWSLIQLQLLTAARSGELVGLRPIDLDRSTPVWTHCPEAHKTAHHGHERFIHFGPRAQELLAPFLLNRTPETKIFSPAEAEADRRKNVHLRRMTPLNCGNKPGSNVQEDPERIAGEAYSQASYRRAIKRACEKAKIGHWHPHRLRHNAATNLRAEFGVEIAQVMLGHAKLDVTQIYAEVNRRKAIEVAGKVG